MGLREIRYRFVKLVYADHNASTAVRRAMAGVLGELQEGDVGLNLGAGDTRVHPQVKNMDIFPAPHIDIVGRAEAIPVADDYFRVVVTQEVIEHVEKPFHAAQEIYRVLQPGGCLYCQLPFVIGYHPGPTDFWRFTKEGIVTLLTSVGFEIEEVGISVGNGTGFYRILVEFSATLVTIPIAPAYSLAKAFFAIAFYPVKWLDYIFEFSQQKDRIAGGYFVVARKKS